MYACTDISESSYLEDVESESERSEADIVGCLGLDWRSVVWRPLRDGSSGAATALQDSVDAVAGCSWGV